MGKETELSEEKRDYWVYWKKSYCQQVQATSPKEALSLVAQALSLTENASTCPAELECATTCSPGAASPYFDSTPLTIKSEEEV